MTEKKHETSQIDKFRDLARDLECDEDEDAFKAKLKQVATAPRSAKSISTRRDR